MYKIEKEFVFRKGIYKDCFSETTNDYQLRPNVLIAMAVSPSLFNYYHAKNYILKVKNCLIEENSIGIKTLDPYDPNYFGNYDNSNDSNNFFKAHGFNYHNGPEWVWLYGYYMMAKFKIK